MEHFEAINYLIKKYNYKSYLEVGVADPSLCFDKIVCESKEGCDPYFDFLECYSDNDPLALESIANRVTYRMTSNEMFETLPPDKKYDVIFVDGLHTEYQTKLDIVNSMKRLNDGGVVFVHDCLPRKEEFSTDERIVDEWYGPVYKAIHDLGDIGVNYVVIREIVQNYSEGDWTNGYAIVKKYEISDENEKKYLEPSKFTWAEYANDTDSVMHIIKIEDFGKKVMIYHNCEYLLKEERRHFDKNGRLVFGGTESWVTGIADNLAKWGYNVTLFTDVLLSNQVEGVSCAKRNSEKIYEHYDAALVTTNIEITSKLNCDNIILCPTCEYFNSNFGEFAPADRVGFLSEWQRRQFENLYHISPDISFRHFLPCKYDEYDNYKEYEKEDAMVWSSAPIRGLRFFIERVMPKIRKHIPDFKLYICGYDDAYYEKEWETYVKGVVPMINAGKHELAELQKKSKIWVYPNIGRSETSGRFKETYCITAVENAMAGNAIVCFGEKDGISSTLEGYEGMLANCPVDEGSDNFMYDYEEAATMLADAAIDILFNDDKRLHLAENARAICKKYTWEKETSIISNEINRR